VILILVSIAVAWLVISVPCALLFARVARLNEENERRERQKGSAAQLELLTTPQAEREHAA
jgi:uncharacterized membrane protein